MVVNYAKKGAQGVGTLIIFIALILVAAVAAGVLIQTASSLQSKALDVGRQSQQKITTDIEVVQLYGQDARDHALNGSVDNLSVVVRLGSGSSPVKLNDMIIKYDTPSGSQTVTYGDSTRSETQYDVTFILNGTNHQHNYLVEGDLATFTFTIQNGSDVLENAHTILRVIARNGAIKPVDITTPPAMVEKVLQFYP